MLGIEQAETDVVWSRMKLLLTIEYVETYIDYGVGKKPTLPMENLCSQWSRWYWPVKLMLTI